MKQIISILALSLTVLIASAVVYGRITQSRRNSHYTAQLNRFQRDVALGTEKQGVEAYLRSAALSWNETTIGGHEGATDLVAIGEDLPGFPELLYCEPLQVYVAFDFSQTNRTTRAFIDRIGTCL